MLPALRNLQSRLDRVSPEFHTPRPFLFGGKMTKEQKDFILKSRAAGRMYSEIAETLKISPYTVKSVCMRNKQTLQRKSESAASVCKQCGAPLEHVPHHKSKKFCSDKCRLSWWHAHRGEVKSASVHICLSCGITFSGDATRKYCSHGCYIKARYA